MKQSVPAHLPLCHGLSEPERLLVERAQAMVARLPADGGGHQPQGTEVALLLKGLNVDLNTLLAAILSDPRLSGLDPKPDLKALFGPWVADLVADVNGLHGLAVYSLDMANQAKQAEKLRRMVLAITKDVRAVLIKLAYQLKRLHLLAQAPAAMRQFIAQETLDIYAPIANRMGVHQFKWELEDLAFRHLQPDAYRHIARLLAHKRVAREQTIARFIGLLEAVLAKEGVAATLHGRPKHIYSIWKKMRHKRLGIDELHDLLAVRVIVDSLAACYAALGLVHAHWRHIPKEFDDYIANPKENGYQSLHTVILDPDGNRIEVQIRTQAMHQFAELGVAAHWAYKEGGKPDQAMRRGIASLRQLLRQPDDDSLQESFRNELFAGRVYVLTPKGQLVELAKGATVLDFAYSIHSEIGHRCRGAKVNGHIVPLSYELSSGEQVEILTAKEGGPNRNWLDPNLGYLKTATALGKAKSWFRRRQQSQNIEAGKAILDKEVRRLGASPPDLAALARHFKRADVDGLLEAIGHGDIHPRQLAGLLRIPALAAPRPAPAPARPAGGRPPFLVNGVDNVLTHAASCCAPVPGDSIIGYISKKKGVTVHRQDCPNITRLGPGKQARLVPVSWGDGRSAHSVPIVVKAYSTQHLLAEVTQVLAKNKTHISGAHLEAHPDCSSTLRLTIQVESAAQLSDALGKLAALPAVFDVKRSG